MLRHAGAVTALAGAAFTIVPGLALQSSSRDEARTRALEHAVHERTRAIAALERLAERVAAGYSDALVEVRTVTEAPTGEARERDERLEALRVEVAELQLAWDGLRGAGYGAAVPEGARPVLDTAVTVGLDADELALLTAPAGSADTRPRAADRRTPSVAPTAAPARAIAVTADELALPESERLRRARAAHLAGQHERALALLDGLAASPAVLHARARSLERLGRLDEALGALRLALADPALAQPEHAALAERVRGDLDYVEWTLALRRAAKDAPKAVEASR